MSNCWSSPLRPPPAQGRCSERASSLGVLLARHDIEFANWSPRLFLFSEPVRTGPDGTLAIRAVGHDGAVILKLARGRFPVGGFYTLVCRPCPCPATSLLRSRECCGRGPWRSPAPGCRTLGQPEPGYHNRVDPEFSSARLYSGENRLKCLTFTDTSKPSAVACTAVALRRAIRTADRSGPTQGLGLGPARGRAEEVWPRRLPAWAREPGREPGARGLRTVPLGQRPYAGGRTKKAIRKLASVSYGDVEGDPQTAQRKPQQEGRRPS